MNSVSLCCGDLRAAEIACLDAAGTPHYTQGNFMVGENMRIIGGMAVHWGLALLLLSGVARVDNCGPGAWTGSWTDPHTNQKHGCSLSVIPERNCLRLCLAREGQDFKFTDLVACSDVRTPAGSQTASGYFFPNELARLRNPNGVASIYRDFKPVSRDREWGIWVARSGGQFMGNLLVVQDPGLPNGPPRSYFWKWFQKTTSHYFCDFTPSDTPRDRGATSSTTPSTTAPGADAHPTSTLPPADSKPTPQVTPPPRTSVDDLSDDPGDRVDVPPDDDIPTIPGTW